MVILETISGELQGHYVIFLSAEVYIPTALMSVNYSPSESGTISVGTIVHT